MAEVTNAAPIATPSSNPSLAQELKVKGNQAWKEGKVNEALALYSDAIVQDPKAPELYRNRSATYVSLQNYESALSDAETSIQLDSSAKSHYRKAEILFHLGISRNDPNPLDDAVKCFEKSYSIEPVPELKHTIEETEYYINWMRCNGHKLVPSSSSLHRELMSICIGAAQKAGDIIRDVWKSGQLDIRDKGNDDPFTIADVKSQQLIMGLLQKKYPKLKMVGEEDCQIPPTAEEPNTSLVDLSKVPEQLRSVLLSDLCVFIDPLDATKEYTLGNLEVGIGYRGEAIGGVMFQPFVNDATGNGITIWSLRGMGVHGVVKEAPRNNLIIATTRTHSDKDVEAGIQALAPQEVMRIGGAGYKSLLVLQGKADLYLFPTKGTKKWDTCAPEAIMREGGGFLTDKYGRNYPYLVSSEVSNDDGVLASMKDHSKYVDILRKLWTPAQ